MNAGDIRLGDTFDVKFTSIDSTGLGTALVDGTVASYPANSATEITAGITLNTSFDARTGLNNVRVVASSENGYATATDYTLVLTAGTVSSVSVNGYVVGYFSIEKRSALIPTVAARTLDVSATGEAGVEAVGVSSFGIRVGVSSFGVPVGVSSMNVPVDVSSFYGSGAVTTLAGTLGVGRVGVSSFGLPTGVSSFALRVGVSSFDQRVGVSSMNIGVAVTTMSASVDVSSVYGTAFATSAPGYVNVNVSSIAGSFLTGSGTSSDPWTPA